ncbi:hypothetical protein RIF29_18833 [Crotalaria pallida]|uniref:beta-aspartyl-peptidase n=1 Tax=Crotalaria pallida TaxID=3830 RepID=A0AAN9F0V6_CROPI
MVKQGLSASNPSQSRDQRLVPFVAALSKIQPPPQGRMVLFEPTSYQKASQKPPEPPFQIHFSPQGGGSVVALEFQISEKLGGKAIVGLKSQTHGGGVRKATPLRYKNQLKTLGNLQKRKKNASKKKLLREASLLLINNSNHFSNEWSFQEASEKLNRQIAKYKEALSHGNLASATSTGGLVNKMVGRIGDTPVIGAGTYANELCAVSATGKGEEIIRATVSRDVAALMEFKGLSLKEAANYVVNERTTKGTVGLIVVSAAGEIAMPYNTTGMFRACATEDGYSEVAIWSTS